MTSNPDQDRPSGLLAGRRRLIAAVIVVLVVAGMAGIAFGWWFFFGTEAPPAPTLDDALRSLQTAPPVE